MLCAFLLLSLTACAITEDTADSVRVQRNGENDSYFDYHTGSLSMFQIMISELEEDEPLKAVFVYNKRKYKEESVAAFSEIFHRKLAAFQEDKDS